MSVRSLARNKSWLLLSSLASLFPQVSASLLSYFPSKGFNRDNCLAYTLELLKNNAISLNHPFFFRDSHGVPLSSLDHPVVTVEGCKALCGSGRGWYIDIGPRITTWLLPVFLLLANMEVAPLDKRRYLMVLHLVGDPIDSIFSMLLKIEAWRRCHFLSKKLVYSGCRHGFPKAFVRSQSRRNIRNVATILGALEELVGFDTSPESFFVHIIETTDLNPVEMEVLLDRTAHELADSRTDERLRTLLAAFFYIFQVTSAFVATIGGESSSPPGGRIGTAMLLTWILPAILLSNAIGCFNSPYTCFRIVERFLQRLNPAQHVDLWSTIQRESPQFKQADSKQEYFDSQAWSGAIYTYRPKKQLVFSSGERDRSP